MHMRLHAFFAFALVLPCSTAASAASEQPVSHCVFQASGVGSCGRLLDQTPVMTLHRAAAPTTGRWRDDVQPVEVWTGDMTDDGNPNQPLELESFADGSGVLRTEYGWFPAMHVMAFAEPPF